MKNMKSIKIPRTAKMLAASLSIIGAGVSMPSVAASSCDEFTPGEFTCGVGWRRDYLAYVPASYDGTSAVPLVVSMHGFASSAEKSKAKTGWDTLADEKGFIVVYPNAKRLAWNAQGECCGVGSQNDVKFLRDVVADVKGNANIVSDEIYAVGHSNGGSMAHRLACEAADLFAGAGPTSYGIAGGNDQVEIIANCNPSEPLPVIHFHGDNDDSISYTDGMYDSLGAQDSLDAWAVVQDCETESSTETLSANTSCETHSSCNGGVKVSMCTVAGGTHEIYADTAGAGIASFTWDFFQSIANQ